MLASKAQCFLLTDKDDAAVNNGYHSHILQQVRVCIAIGLVVNGNLLQPCQLLQAAGQCSSCECIAR